jgi:hypothetical protein
MDRQHKFQAKKKEDTGNANTVRFSRECKNVSACQSIIQRRAGTIQYQRGENEFLEWTEIYREIAQSQSASAD